MLDFRPLIPSMIDAPNVTTKEITEEREVAHKKTGRWITPSGLFPTSGSCQGVGGAGLKVRSVARNWTCPRIAGQSAEIRKRPPTQ
ncbi:hypothetical protein CEXT_661601 [Caerostris extrusa]|uniref:Uncharacterized protein n=1 Tax=Caerostris extrusa TaxID=172846 RepID=A0AAV4W8U9_CAEEX|nr:hypothetical protein CEXT_661601 [Caerostris extrusa]